MNKESIHLLLIFEEHITSIHYFMKPLLITIYLFFSLASLVQAQNIFYWNPISDNKASNINNWHLDNCNGPAGMLPGENDTIVFTDCAGANSQCNIDLNLTVNNLRLTAGFTDTVYLNAGSALTFYTSEFTSGVFMGNTGKIFCYTALSLNGTHFTSTADSLFLYGDFHFLSGVFNHNNGTVCMKGNQLQNLFANSIPAFYNLLISKDDFFSVLHSEITIASQLNLLKGFIVSDSINTLTILKGAGVINDSEISFVRGTVKKIGNSTFKFPIGSGWKHKPVKISAPSSATEEFTATYIGESQKLGNEKDNSLSYISNCEYYKITHPKGTSSVTLRIYWDQLTCDIDTLPTLRIGRWNTSLMKWENTGNTITSGDTLDGNLVTESAQSSFGYFVIAKSSPMPIVNAGNDLVACAGTRVKLGGSPSIIGGTPPYNISWSPTVNIDSITSKNPEVTVFDDIDYVLTVIDADDAQATDTIHIKVNGTPQVNAGFDRFVLPESTIQLGSINTASGGAPPYSYLWTPSLNLDQNNIEKPLAIINSTSSYTLTVTDQAGCVGTDAVNLIINLPSPGKAGVFGLLAGDSLICTESILVDIKAGSRTYISPDLHSSDTLVIHSLMDSIAIDDLHKTIEQIKLIPGNSIGSDLSNITLGSGSYNISSTATLDGMLTLTGDAQSYFIFNISDSFIIANNSQVLLDGVSRSRVFFRAGKDISIQGEAMLPVIMISEKNISGGSISRATLLCLGKITFSTGTFKPQSFEARVTSVSRNDAAGFLGYNSSNVWRVADFFPSHLSFGNVRTYLPMMNGTVLRFPAGGIVKEWNTIDGWFINPAELADSNSLIYSKASSCLSFSSSKVSDLEKLPVDRLLELRYCLKGSGMKLLLPLNIFTKMDFQKSIIQHAISLNIDVPYVELGNEFYLKGQTCFTQQPEDYAQTVNEYLNMIHNTPSFNAIKVGIVGSSWTTETTQSDDQACRRKTWNASLLPNLSGTKPGDGITFHIYCETGFDALGGVRPISKPEFIQPFFRKAFETIDTFANHELKTLNDYPDLNAWITEYNLTDKNYNIHGSWAHALFLSVITLRLLEFEKIKFVNCQTIINDAGRGMIFNDDLGFNFGRFWSSIDTSLRTRPWSFSACGMVMKMIGDAMRYSTQASLLQFPDIPTIVESEYPSVYGWTFDKDLGDKQSILINLSEESQTIDISQLQPATAFEQVYCKSPLYYVTGKVWWPAPYNNYFNAASRISPDSLSKPVNFDSISVKLPSGVSVITLPPYSVTRLYRLNTNSVWLRQNDNQICAKDENSYDTIHASTSVNLYASGGAYYQWLVGDEAKNQQSSVSAGGAAPLNGGSIKAFDPEGNLLGEKNDININVKPLPDVSVTPSSFNNSANGSSFTATASGATTYNWSPTIGISNVSSNIITITPYSSGTYHVVGTDDGYCSKIQKIKTNISPVVSIYASNEGIRNSSSPPFLQMCSEEAITLTANGNADSYQWFSSDGSVNATGPSVTFTPSADLLITLIATDHLSGTTSKSYLKIELQPQLSVPQKDLYGCENSFVNISISFDNGSDNTTYCWNDQSAETLLFDTKDFTKPISDNQCKGSFGGVFINAPAGDYTVLGSVKDPDYLPCKGDKNSTSINIHLKTPETLIPAASTCVLSGGKVTLTASGSGDDFTWTGPGLLSSIGKTIEAMPDVSPAVYTVTSGNSGCCASAVTTVIIDPVNANCDGSTYCYGCNGKVVTVTPYDPLNYQYQWYENGIAVPGETNAAYTAFSMLINSIEEKTIYCTVNKIDGSCAPGKTNLVKVTLNTGCNIPTIVPILQAAMPSLSVYPNPSANNFFIEYSTCKPENRMATIEIVDLYTKVLWIETVELANGNLRKEFHHSLNDGIYMIRVCENSNCLSGKLMIAH